jgi:hypothetical protein
MNSAGSAQSSGSFSTVVRFVSVQGSALQSFARIYWFPRVGVCDRQRTFTSPRSPRFDICRLWGDIA